MGNLLSSQPIQFSSFEIITNFIISIILGITVALIYRQTHRGMSYSQSFVTALVLLTIISSMVVMIIGNSLVRAFGLIGAFTIIRFRTAIKEVRDLTFMFLAVTLGLAAGVKAYTIGAAGLIAVAGVMLVLDKIRFGTIANYEYLLTFIEKPDSKKGNQHDEIFKLFLSESLLLNARPIKGGEELEFSYSVRLKDPESLSDFTQKLSKLSSVQNVELVSVQRDIEY